MSLWNASPAVRSPARRHRGLGWMCLALLAMPGGVRAAEPGDSEPAPAPLASLTERLRPLVGQTLGAGVTVEAIETRGEPPGDQVRVSLRGADGAGARLIISRLPHGGAPAGARVSPSLLFLPDPRTPPPALVAGVEALVERAGRLDRGQFNRRGGPGAGGAHSGRRDPGGPPTTGLLPVTWALLALSLIFVPLALWASLGLVRTSEPGLAMASSSRWHVVWLSVPLFALLLRVWIEPRLVMVYFGYLHLDQARDLAVLPRYGAATAALYHALFWWLPAHHHTVQGLHALLGSLTLWPLGALAAGFLPPGRDRVRTAALVGLLLAALPLSILDHGSESILVPAFLWWSAGVVLLDAWLAHRRIGSLLGAGALLTLCGLSRPDCMVVALPGAMLYAGARRGWGALWQARLALGAWVAGVALASLPGAVFVWTRATEDAAMGNLPELSRAVLADLPARLWERRLWTQWVVLRPRYFPLALTLILAGALVATVAAGSSARLGALRERRGGLFALAGLSLLWAVPMWLDFNETSLLRLHAPSAMLMTAGAAAALGALFSRTPATSGGRWLGRAGPRRALAAGLGLLIAGGYAGTVGDVFARQNSDLDDELLQMVGVHSHDGRPAVYVTRSYDDPPDRGVHLFVPGYILEAGDRWQGVSAFERGAARRAGERVFYVQGLRCRAHRRAPVDPGANWQHPACADFCRRHRCRRVFSLQVPNLGERAFDWYPSPAAVPWLDAGLWEVSADDDATTNPRPAPTPSPRPRPTMARPAPPPGGPPPGE